MLTKDMNPCDDLKTHWGSVMILLSDAWRSENDYIS
jgi:hypothetical protein